MYVKVVVVAALNYIGEGLRRGLLRDYEPSDGPFWSTSGHSVPPDKSVGGGDGVEVALLPIVHKRVRFPYFPQHLYWQRQFILWREFTMSIR